MNKLLSLTAGLASLAAATLALTSTAQAAPVISAQSIIVNPVSSPVNVRVWTDRDPSGAATPSYQPGEKIRLYTSVSQDSYVYLFNVDPNGKVDLILPNRYQGGANFLKANTTKVFPAANDPFTFDIAAPYGVNKVLALASRTRLNIDQIATFKSQQSSFATVNVQNQGQLAQALSIVVRPVQQNTWDSATAFYNVVSRVAVPVSSQPFTPQPVEAQPGTSQPTTAQPLAQQPAPRTAQALSIAVKPAAPAPQVGPWGSARNWSTTLDTRSSLAQVHAEYAARLKAEGYTLVSSKARGNHIDSTFRKADGGTAQLAVKQKGPRTEIQVTRK